MVAVDGRLSGVLDHFQESNSTVWFERNIIFDPEVSNSGSKAPAWYFRCMAHAFILQQLEIDANLHNTQLLQRMQDSLDLGLWVKVRL